MSSPAKPHKPVVAIGALLLLFNGLLLYVSSPETTGDGGIGSGKIDSSQEKPWAESELFVMKNDRIFYRSEEISWERFEEITSSMPRQEKVPEIYFELKTTTSGFYDRVKSFLRTSKIIFRERSALEKK